MFSDKPLHWALDLCRIPTCSICQYALNSCYDLPCQSCSHNFKPSIRRSSCSLYKKIFPTPCCWLCSNVTEKMAPSVCFCSFLILLKRFQIKFFEGMRIIQVFASGLNFYLAVMVASVITTFQLVMPTRRKKYAMTYCLKKKHVRNKCPVIFELFIDTAYAIKYNGQRDSRTKWNRY